jgi:hypothetical protein
VGMFHSPSHKFLCRLWYTLFQYTRCAYVAINVKMIMEIVSYSTITDKGSHENINVQKGLKDERINKEENDKWCRRYDTKYVHRQRKS